MGQTNPTYRDRLNEIEKDWKPFRRALRRNHKQSFDDLMTQARNYAHAGGCLDETNLETTVLLSIVLAQEQRIAELEEIAVENMIS